MIPQQNSPRPPQALVFWILWFAILQGLVIIQFFVGGGIPAGADQGNPPVGFLALTAGLALAALGIRFTWIPQIKEVPKKLPAMIIGLALSEGIGMIGMFCIGHEFPKTQLALFITAIVCIVSFAPVYAKERVQNGRF